jgi:hypothetical protein
MPIVHPDSTCAVTLSNAVLPAAAWYFCFLGYFDVSLAERNIEVQKKGKVSLRTAIVLFPVNKNGDRSGGAAPATSISQAIRMGFVITGAFFFTPLGRVKQHGTMQ